MKAQPMITVQSVRQSADWYHRVLGFESAHGGDEYEQLLSEGRLVLQLHNSEADMNHPALLNPGEVPGLGCCCGFKRRTLRQPLSGWRKRGCSLRWRPT